ncbi:MAG: tyrosine-type recombinase/integrase [Methylococcales bacterium]|nr:tyrosine-type recombinase/integrase [Methylococcales bacterium]
MTALAPHLCSFLQEHLPDERGASIHTQETYAYGFQLLLRYVAKCQATTPSALELEQINTSTVVAFLNYLEQERGNAASTRNGRLAAIKAFFRFIEYRVPCCIEQARQIRAIPIKKTDSALQDYLSTQELQCVLDAPDPRIYFGIRDRAMLHLAFAAGLRVSELVSLLATDLQLSPEPSVRVMGKGRRERILPLWKQTTKCLRAWIEVRVSSQVPELFLNRHGIGMTRSGFEYILNKHCRKAALDQNSLSTKKISPHILRRTCAMQTLQATRDIRKVSLWLGHASTQSTEAYLRMDPSEKLEMMDSMLPPSVSKGNFRITDKLLHMINPKNS